MDEKDRTVLEYVGLAVLGNAALLAALVLLAAWQLGWWQGLRRVWEWALVVSLYFGLAIAGVLIVLPPVSEWVLLHVHFDARQIQDEGLRVERFNGKKSVVFSNGEQRPVGLGHPLLMGLLCQCWWLLDVWVTRRVVRRFAPSVWAEFAGNRRGAAARPVSTLTRRPPTRPRDMTRQDCS